MTTPTLLDARWQWTAEAPNPLDPKGKWKIVDPDGGVIARLEVHPNSDEEAPIIAAAPDLLAALQGLMKGCDVTFGPEERVTMRQLYPRQFATAEAAIAKAEGR